MGDVINIKGDWVLAEWYPNYRTGKPSKDAENNATDDAQEDAKAAGA